MKYTTPTITLAQFRAQIKELGYTAKMRANYIGRSVRVYTGKTQIGAIYSPQDIEAHREVLEYLQEIKDKYWILYSPYASLSQIDDTTEGGGEIVRLIF